MFVFLYKTNSYENGQQPEQFDEVLEWGRSAGSHIPGRGFGPRQPKNAQKHRCRSKRKELSCGISFLAICA